MEAGRGAWASVTTDPKDAAGLGSAKLSIVVTAGCQHNRLAKVTPEVLFVDVGVPKKSDRANVELLGFIGFLLDLKEDQVCLESGATGKGKVVKLIGIRHEKRELIWALEGKVGQRHDAHFAADNVNAARNFFSKEAVKRRREQDEFQSLRDEALSAPAALSGPNLLLGAPPAKRALPASLAGGGGGAPRGAVAGGAPEAARDPEPKAADGSEASADGAEVGTPPPAAGSGGGTAGGGGGAAAAAAAEPAAGGPEGGGLGLAAYDSDEESEEEDDDRPRLPRPEL